MSLVYRMHFSQEYNAGHFTINNFFLYVTKTQPYQQKTEKFFVSEEKKFGRIDSRSRILKIFCQLH